MGNRIGIIVISDSTDANGRLEATLDSIDAQTFPRDRIDLILVGPTDPGPLAERADQWIPTATECQGTALNAALEHVDSDFILFADTGALWSPSKLARQVQVFDSDEEAAVCVHPVEGFGVTDLAKRWGHFGPLATLFMAQPWPLGVAAVRHDAIERLRRLREIPLAEWEASIRMLLTGHGFVVLPDVMAQCQRPRKPEIPTLCPPQGRPPFIKEHLEDVGVKDLFRHTVLKSVADGYAFKAGLYNIHGFLAESHDTIDRARLIGDSPLAHYWRGIMLRRLTHYDDALASLDDVGDCPFADELYTRADAVMAAAATVPEARAFRAELAAVGRWAPKAFAAWCARLQISGASEDAIRVAERIQHQEMQALLAATYAAAVRQTP